MKKIFKIVALVFVMGLFFFCNKKSDSQETILKGSVKIVVDETLQPIIEDQVLIFESEYDAKIAINAKSETEVLQSLFKDTLQIAVLAKKLSSKDSLYFLKRKIIVKQTPIATDAIALITNKKNNDTLVALQDVVDFMKGKSVPKIKGLVFDNPNSSTVRYMTELAGNGKITEKNIFSFKTNNDVIKYVAENQGMIGVVGINWIFEPNETTAKYLDKISVMNVKGIGKTDFVAPSQDNLGSEKYPLARELYIVNCQGYSGLGMGFASFVAGERGQRIILKSGLLPWKTPTRRISVKH